MFHRDCYQQRLLSSSTLSLDMFRCPSCKSDREERTAASEAAQPSSHSNKDHSFSHSSGQYTNHFAQWEPYQGFASNFNKPALFSPGKSFFPSYTAGSYREQENPKSRTRRPSSYYAGSFGSGEDEPMYKIHEQEKIIYSMMSEIQDLYGMLFKTVSEKEELRSRHKVEMKRLKASINQRDRNDDFMDCSSRSSDDMDSEHIPFQDELHMKDKHTSKTKGVSSSKKISKPSLLLECLEGPHKGEAYLLTDKLLIGKGRNSKGMINLCKDPFVESAHAKLVLCVKGTKKNPLIMARIYDLKSNAGLKVNKKKLPQGSDRQIFVKDVVSVGTTVLKVTANK